MLTDTERRALTDAEADVDHMAEMLMHDEGGRYTAPYDLDHYRAWARAIVLAACEESLTGEPVTGQEPRTGEEASA
jgi:hypothetical protein